MAEKMKKAMIVSVGTGKEGKDIAHGICFSIRQNNPDFLIFLTTDESRKTTLPFVFDDCDRAGRKPKEIKVTDPDDVEKITLDCQGVIKDLVRDGYDLANMVVDYTSGTKAMSAGLCIASIREKVGALIYISGKRGEGGRVISGTERALSVVPNQIFAGDLFKEAIDSFNIYHFDVTLKILAEARDMLSDPDFLKNIQVLEILSKAYALWDRFEVGDAFQILKSVREEDLLKRWGIGKQIELNKQALYQEKEHLFCPERMFDLLENARRRGDEERKFDDAVARLYRVCEYIGQHELNKLGLYRIKNSIPDTSDLDLSKLPPHLSEKYCKYTDTRDGKAKIHLSGNYNLLFDLNHPIGNFFKENEIHFKKLMGLRDLSILAHGFNPVSESTYKDMLELIENFIRNAKFDETDIQQRVKFPKIKIETIL